MLYIKWKWKPLLILLLVLGVSFLYLTSPAWAIQLKQVYSKVNFEKPVLLLSSPDSSNRLFIVEQRGVVKVLSHPLGKSAKKARFFLNIQDRVYSRYNESGLLSIAFHPNYVQNGFFFVSYTASSPFRSVISRFQVSKTDPNQALIQTEKVILEVNQPFGNHNGGHIAFGSDGYLYLALGDGGSGGDPHKHAQNLSTLLGSILRIDINSSKGKAYAIPPDNPFVQKKSSVRKEIWAYGLRNPWRFSFDRKTGNLYAGDVGQNDYEEIDWIQKGKNYGWNRLEGKHCYKSHSANCQSPQFVPPLVEYSHDEGYSVTGGVVYRGKKIPQLQGIYLYADFGSGKIWGLNVTSYKNQLLLKTPHYISSFGEDQSGEVFIID